MNQPLAIALVVVGAKLWLHYYTGQTFKLTGVWLTHIKEFGIPPDYYHIHWFSMRCFRSSIAIICCAAVDQNRLFKSTASEEKREFHFPFDTCICKTSLTTDTLIGLQFSLINLTSWHHRARVSRIKSRRQFVLVLAQTCKLRSGAEENWGIGLVKSLFLSEYSWQIPTPQLDAMNQFLNYLLSVKKLNSPCKDSDWMHTTSTSTTTQLCDGIIDSELQIQSTDSLSSWSGHQLTNLFCTN